MDTKKRTIQTEIDHILEIMASLSVTSKEYKVAAENLKVLMETDNKSKISADTMILAMTNIAGILLVLNFEKVGVITSKAFGMLRRS